MLLSARDCVEASMRACICACVCACFYCAPEDVFPSVFQRVYVCFSLPVSNTVSVIALCLCACV